MKSSLYLILFSFILSSCGLSKTILNIDYKPNYSLTKKSEVYSKSVKIDKMVDNRGYSDPNVIFHKKDGYGYTTAGSYVMQEPLVDLLTREIKVALRKLEIETETNDSDYILKSELVGVGYRTIIGSFSISEVIPHIGVHFKLLNKNKEVVWEDTIIAKGNTKTTKLEVNIPVVIDKLIEDLTNDEVFLNKFK